MGKRRRLRQVCLSARPVRGIGRGAGPGRRRRSRTRARRAGAGARCSPRPRHRPRHPARDHQPGHRRHLEYDLTPAATDRLVVDTREGAVTLNNASPRLYTATARSTPEQAFTLPSGPSLLTFRAEEFNDAGALTVLWRSAWW